MVRLAALDAAGELGLPEPLAGRVVTAAVQSLEQWAGERPEVVTALTEELTDPDPGVRTQVRWALA